MDVYREMEFFVSDMLSKFKGLLLSAVLLFGMSAASVANSATFDLGTLSDSASINFESQMKAIHVTPGTNTVTDTYTFSLSQASNVELGLSNLSIGSVFGSLVGLDSLSLALGSKTLVLPDSSISGEMTVFNLLADTVYSFTVTGVPGGSLGRGVYGGSVQVTAVPLPAAVWLFATALFGLFGFKRVKESRRSS